MSYSLTLSFTHCENILEALDLINNFASDLTSKEYKQKFINDNIRYSPFHHRITIKNMNDEFELKDTDKYWLLKLFSIKCIWWEKEKLFAIFGSSDFYPEKLWDKYFKTTVNFQNSCDQDYEIEYWNTDIKVFAESIDKINALDITDIINKANQKYEFDKYELKEVQSDKEKAEYYRRTMIYDEIYDRLEIAHLAYDADPKDIRVFAINALKNYMEPDISACNLYAAIKNDQEEYKKFIADISNKKEQ